MIGCGKARSKRCSGRCVSDRTSKQALGTSASTTRDARSDSAPRRFFALVCLSGGGFDAENGFAFLHQIEPVARDRFQIRGIGFQQIHFARLLGKQHLLFVALRLQLVDLVVAHFQFFVWRHEQTDDDEPDREQKQSQEDTVPTLPNGSFATRAEICVIHFQRILPP